MPYPLVWNTYSGGDGGIIQIGFLILMAEFAWEQHLYLV
jgi:hypothetical protein